VREINGKIVPNMYMKFLSAKFLVSSKRKAPQNTLVDGRIFLREDKTNWLVALGLRATSWGPIHDVFERDWKVSSYWLYRSSTKQFRITCKVSSFYVKYIGT
jgi:hypothetical protein